jgi:hypothetical protein
MKQSKGRRVRGVIRGQTRRMNDEFVNVVNCIKAKSIYQS